jgi:hypothetical protein
MSVLINLRTPGHLVVLTNWFLPIFQLRKSYSKYENFVDIIFILKIRKSQVMLQTII